MAKVKSSGLRNYVGRLGGSVYYMLKGQNIAREKAPEVSNPRTATQMRQRMQWANLVAMYKCLQSYLGKKSFQYKLATWSDYNAFMSANLGAAPVYLTKDMVQNGHALLAPYKVTEGSLPAINTQAVANSKVFDTDIMIGENIGPNTTIGELSYDIVENNPGWQYGDQLGIIVMENGRMYRPYVQAFEIILNENDETPLVDLVPSDDAFFTTNDDGYLALDADILENPTQGLAYACAVIHSRTISGKTSVSTQSLVLNGSAMTEYREATTEEAFNNARESYGIPTEVWLDAGYQGESGEPAALALVSVAEEVTTETTPSIKLMNAGGKNEFFNASSVTDVDFGGYIILRFNRNHGFTSAASVELTYDKGESQGTGISYQGTPDIAANYVRLKVDNSEFTPLVGGALTFHLEVDGTTYDLSLTA